IAVVTNSLPYTGVTLPLVSFGGSSTVISLVAIGLLLNISRQPAASSEGDDNDADEPEPPDLPHIGPGRGRRVRRVGGEGHRATRAISGRGRIATRRPREP